MKIAVLGWGSLIWEPQGLPLKESWLFPGPTLPIEFSRASKNGRLTLVIDPQNGVAVTTYFATSSKEELNKAISDLAAREQTILGHIGYLDLENGRHRCNTSSDVVRLIRPWANGHRYNAVIWTDLPSNFLEKTGMAFSVGAAVRYLTNLAGDSETLARKYIENAPQNVTTPLRKRLREMRWCS